MPCSLVMRLTIQRSRVDDHGFVFNEALTVHGHTASR
jgi:hypothetical protein